MKVLFVVNNHYPHVNGVYSFVKTIASELQKQEHEVAVVAPAENLAASKKAIDGITVVGVPSVSIFVYGGIRIPVPFLLEARLDAILQQFAPDVIHIQDHFLLTKALVKINRKHGIPLVATNHFMTENFTSFFKSTGIRKFLEEWMWTDFSKVFNEMNVVTTPTETAAELIRPKLKRKVVAVSNGINLQKFSRQGSDHEVREKYSLSHKPILLYVGRLDPEKRIEDILQAVALDNRRTNFCFVVVGKGTRKKALEALAAKLGLNDRIVFTGYVPDEDLRSLYQASRCFITASIAELQSIATMEAMASGLPVVAADAGALAELVREGVNGHLFTPGDTAKILQSIRSVFQSETIYRQMKAESLQMIQRHRLDKTVSSYINIYDGCLNPAC